MTEGQMKELVATIVDVYKRGYHQGVKEANERIERILQEEGFWDE